MRSTVAIAAARCSPKTTTLGASSRDIRLRASIELPDDPALAPLVPDEELLEINPSRFTQGYRG